MYGVRARSNDLRGLKVGDDGKTLSEAIHVNQLCQNNPTETVDSINSTSPFKQKELIRRKHHYENFREIYHQKLDQTQKRQNTFKQPCAVDMQGRNSETVDELIKRLRQGHGGDTPQVLKKPFFMRTPLQNMKTVTVEVPIPTTKNAIWCPLRPGDSEVTINGKEKSSEFLKSRENTERCEPNKILKKLFEIEENNKKQKQPHKCKHSDLMKEIHKANLQVDVASQQLQHINSLIQNRKLPPVKEEDEYKEGADSAQSLESAVNSRPSLASTKWHVKTASKGPGDKTKKLVNTLNTLNKRLQSMQDKMLKSRSSYKSINDFFTKGQVEGSVEVLFKNTYYPKTKLNTKNVENSVSNMELTGILDDILKNVKEADPECAALPEESAPESQPKSHKTAARKLSAKEQNGKKNRPLSPKQFLDRNTSSIDYLLHPPNHNKRIVDSKFSLIDKNCLRHEATKANENNGEDTEITISSVFNEALQDSIQKSEYLKKEFSSLKDRKKQSNSFWYNK